MSDQYDKLVQRIEVEIEKSKDIEQRAKENREYANMHFNKHIVELLQKILDDTKE